MPLIEICPSMDEFNEFKENYLKLTTHGGSWISQTEPAVDVPIQVAPPMDTGGGRYDAIMRGTYADGSTWTFGGIEKSLDFCWFAAGKTANGTDGRIRFDVPNSMIYANFTGNGASITGLNASNLSLGTVPDDRFSSGSATASNNSTYISGGAIRLHKRGKTVHVNVEGLAFKAYNNRQTVATVPVGYRPSQPAYGNFNGVAFPYLIINANGSVQVDGTGAAHTKWGWACYTVP